MTWLSATHWTLVAVAIVSGCLLLLALAGMERANSVQWTEMARHNYKRSDEATGDKRWWCLVGCYAVGLLVAVCVLLLVGV